MPYQHISCVSLGMFAIDEIHMPSRSPLLDILGGSATFVTLGLRVIARNSKSVGCLLIAGSDFPASIRKIIEQDWGVTTVVRVREGVKSTRGTLVYADGTFGRELPSLAYTAVLCKAKTFAYQHPALKPHPNDLTATPLLHSCAFHMLASPDKILAQVSALLSLRSDTAERPFVVWEPLPATCAPENYTEFREACKLVDVLSPHHLELGALFRCKADDVDAERLVRCAASLITSGVGKRESGVVIVRTGVRAFYVSKTSSHIRYPAYYEKRPEKVIDATGAGNAFLGGYIAEWQISGGSARESMCYGMVAASFALEQIGLLHIERMGESVNCNGAAVSARLEEYKSTLSHTSL